MLRRPVVHSDVNVKQHVDGFWETALQVLLFSECERWLVEPFQKRFKMPG